MPSQNQASRQPTESIRRCATEGWAAMLVAKPNDIRRKAKPRLCANHCDTRFALHSISEPWPRKRSAPKAMVSMMRLVTVPKPIAAKPKPMATPKNTRLTP